MNTLTLFPCENEVCQKKQKTIEVQSKEHRQREMESDPHRVHPFPDDGKMIYFALSTVYAECYAFSYCLSLLVASALLPHFSSCPRLFCLWEVWVWNLRSKECTQSITIKDHISSWPNSCPQFVCTQITICAANIFELQNFKVYGTTGERNYIMKTKCCRDAWILETI